jgi:predicted  nucleic acid-binding Zn-ribbon protein
MNEEKQPKSSLTEEFRELGKNLMNALQAAWDSPERKKLGDEIEQGIQELGSSLKNEINNLSDSPTGQKIKTEVDDINERIRSGEVEAKLRSDFIDALRTVNDELVKFSEKLSKSSSETDSYSKEEPEK